MTIIHDMQDKFTILAAKVLSGEATQEEKSHFQKLLLLSDDNILLFNQIKEYWQADVTYSKDKKFDHLEALLLQHTAVVSNKRLFIGSKIIPIFYKVAAIIFFVVSCSLFYLYQTNPKQLYTFTAQQSVADYLLADGTKVKLNKNSTLTYRAGFGKKKRIVELTGEAFFEVKKDLDKAFVVRALGTETVVLGTTFNVKADSFKNTVTTTLVEGSVRFDTKKSTFVLQPNDEVVYNTKTNAYKLQKTDLQYNTAWTIGRYIYPDITFGQLIHKLEDIYQVKINISDTTIANKYISASFMTDQTVEEILAAFENQLKFRYQFRDKSYINIIGR
jgi:ferric-dicitrate binding protein FerR (iron transport regulator)